VPILSVTNLQRLGFDEHPGDQLAPMPRGCPIQAEYRRPGFWSSSTSFWAHSNAV